MVYESNKQAPFLLDDIKNYYFTKKNVQEFYFKRYIIDQQKEEYHSYIVNDIKMIFENKNNLNFNILWGLLKPEQRKQVIQNNYKFYF